MKFNLRNEDFVRVATGIPQLRVADCTYNYEQIITLWEDAANKGVQILCLPELSITGYSCGDLFLNEGLIRDAEKSLLKLISQEELRAETHLIVGLPMMVEGRLYNMAALIDSTGLAGLVPKSYLPNYGEFYEKRWFASADDLNCKEISLFHKKVPISKGGVFQYSRFNIGIELCEDLWTPLPPSSIQAMRGAHLLFNLSASNEVAGKHDYLVELVRQQSARCHAAYIYTSAGFGESTTDLVYAGKGIIAENGTLMHQSERFERKAKLGVADIDLSRLKAERIRKSSFTEPLKRIIQFNEEAIVCNDQNFRELIVSQLYRSIAPHPFIPSEHDYHQRCEEIFEIQAAGLAKRMTHTGAKSMVIGISGGLDSTLALLVCVKCCELLNLPPTTIVGVTMPGFGTTDRTYTNALQLMESLGITRKEIDIRPACLQHFADLEHDAAVHDVTYENTQARERTQILMNLANKMGGIVIGTGDLSELALGWATYNGDHMSMYGVNSSIPKTLVRHLVKWVAATQTCKTVRATLLDIVDTPVSPELLPADASGNIAQKTEDIVGPYELHDFFLYYMVRFGFSPKRILLLAQQAFKGVYSVQTIQKWLVLFLHRFFQQQFKRSCMPDGPKVGSINLSPRGDWRMPSDASAALWITEAKNAHYLIANSAIVFSDIDSNAN